MGKTSGDRSAIGSPVPDDIDVADVIPFLVIGAISAARRILAIGAKLSLGEAQQPVRAGGSLASGGSWYRFDEAMIELGVDSRDRPRGVDHPPLYPWAQICGAEIMKTNGRWLPRDCQRKKNERKAVTSK
jgi:hypothetical protein